MTSLNRVEGFSMLKRPHSIAQTLVPVLAFVTLANLGCAPSIAANHPHLDRRSVCLRVPGIEPDSSEFIFTPNNVPISNFHPEIVDRVAAETRIVFEVDPAADPDSVRYLPAPYNELTCPERFSLLPSKDAETLPFPEASVDLLVHERRPEIVSRAIAEKLASCPSPSSGQLDPIDYTVSFNVYVTNDGQAVSAYIEQSTLGDRQTETCMVNALRTTSWPAVVASAPEVAAAPALKTFLAQPAPAVPVPDSGPESGVRLRLPGVEPPGEPGGFRIPYVGVLRFAAPALAGGLVFVTITLWPNAAAPKWLDELNPITRRPYTSPEEYEVVRRLPPEEIQQRQRQEAIKNAQPVAPQAPPASAPSPQPQPQPAPQEQPECPRNERFIPEPNGTHNATGCYTKKGDLQCYSRRHYPCAGVHTHGIFTYQEMRGDRCVEVKKPNAVRCEGEFKKTVACGSVSTVLCGDEGTATSGIYLKEQRLDTP